MEYRLSDRLERLAESKTLRMARLSRELKDKGVDIISLSLGEPDFNTPEFIGAAAKEAIDKGITHYPPVAGFEELREAIAEKHVRKGLSVNASNVVVSTGAKQTLANIIQSLIQPGDEVVIPSPYWVSYPEMVAMAGGTSVFIHAGIAQDFKISPEQLDEALGENTRMFIFSSPSNPTGKVYSAAELEGLAEVFKKHPQVLIVSDEIYEHINFEGEHYSISANTHLLDRLAIVNGMSKGYAMTGWRLGYMVAPLWLAKACEKIQGQVTSGASSISQMAALAAVKSRAENTYEMREAFKKRRDMLIEQLSLVEGLRISKPEGAFYLFIDVSALYGKSFNGDKIACSEDLAMFLLKEAQVSIVAGDAFGDDNCIRISYAASDEDLQEASRRIANAIAKLS